MVAPNGARRTKSDHPALPVTIPEIVETAIDCHAAGAGGLHAHVRDKNQDHVLDAGLYLELISELNSRAPNLQVQITTEAVGKYTPVQQRALVNQVRPESVSVALSEMTSDLEAELGAVRNFYHDQRPAGTMVQHILYAADEIAAYSAYVGRGIIPDEPPQFLFVLGRHTKDQQSDSDDLKPFLKALSDHNISADWAVCAFGQNETECLRAGFRANGKARVGFENSIWMSNGQVAVNNADRVAELQQILKNEN